MIGVRSYMKPNTTRFGLLTALLVLLSWSTLRAQQWPFELWHEGKIVLLEGDTLRGTIKYDLQQDLLQYTWNSQKVEAFSARKVLFFEIFDRTVSRYRQFYALPYTTAAGYKAPIFFELLVEGKMTMLVRESIEYRTYTSSYYGSSYSRQVMVYRYFFLKEDGTITDFQGNKNDLLDLMGKHAGEVEKYIRSNRLKYDDKYDLAKIVTYYNSFF